MCVFETTEGRGTFSVKSVTSSDEGTTWGNRSVVYAPSDPSKNGMSSLLRLSPYPSSPKLFELEHLCVVVTRPVAGAPQVVENPDGTLVVSFMTDEDNDAAHTWPAGAAFKIVTSAAGDNWGDETQVTGIPSYWPGLFSQSDGDVLACVGYADEGCICLEVTFS